jgi:hypothetical protein
VRPVFTAIASVQVGICLLTIPMCKSFLHNLLRALIADKDIFGKKSRSFFHRHNVFFKFTDAIADKIMVPLDWVARKVLGH